MQAQVFHFSEINPKDRLTVEHYISSDLALMQQIRETKYSLEPLGKLAIVKGGKRLPPNAQYSPTGVPYVRVVDIGQYMIDLAIPLPKAFLWRIPRMGYTFNRSRQ